MQITFDPTNKADLVGVYKAIGALATEAGLSPAEATLTPVPVTQTTTTRTAPDRIVYNPDGTKAGFAHSYDAAAAIIHVGAALTSMADIEAFVSANLKTIAKLDKADKNRVNEAIAARAGALKDGAGEPDAQSPASAEAALAAAFGGATPPAETTKPPALSKEEFSKRMLALGEKMGPQGMGKFGETVRKKYGSILQVPQEDFTLVLSAAEEFLTELQK